MKDSRMSLKHFFFNGGLVLL